MNDDPICCALCGEQLMALRGTENEDLVCLDERCELYMVQIPKNAAKSLHDIGEFARTYK